MNEQLMKDRARINELYYRILENKAEVSEYYEYERILSKYYQKERIWQDLGAQGFRSWEDFYAARNPRYKPAPKTDNTMPILVGAVLGLGLAIIVANFLNKD